MDQITAVIITLNEERNIGRCLDSLKRVADELIVIDSFSSDRTEKICKERGARFVEKEWQGYSRTKNAGNDLATHPFILSIDADEALSIELQESIREEKTKGLHGVYGFNRLTNYCGKWIKHCGWYPDKKVRLFQKGMAEWKGDHVHEELMLSPGLQIEWLNGDLHHYSYYTRIEHRERAMQYARLGAEKIKHKRGLGLKLLLSPPFRFFQMYVLQRGFLDGKAGFDICRITAWEVMMKYKLGIRGPSA